MRIIWVLEGVLSEGAKASKSAFERVECRGAFEEEELKKGKEVRNDCNEFPSVGISDFRCFLGYLEHQWICSPPFLATSKTK